MTNQSTTRCQTRGATVTDNGGWRPITTAPKDGTRILLYIPESRIANVHPGWWSCGDWMFDKGDEATAIDIPVTHWMPLLAPPDRSDA